MADKQKKDRINAYIEAGLKRKSQQFMNSDKHYETYRSGGLGLLITHALKAYMGIGKGN